METHANPAQEPSDCNVPSPWYKGQVKSKKVEQGDMGGEGVDQQNLCREKKRACI